VSPRGVVRWVISAPRTSKLRPICVLVSSTWPETFAVFSASFAAAMALARLSATPNSLRSEASVNSNTCVTRAPTKRTSPSAFEAVAHQHNA
jgi:hypothetical protein